MQFLETLDWLVIGVYFLLVVGIAVWSMRKKNDSMGNRFGFYFVKTYISQLK